MKDKDPIASKLDSIKFGGVAKMMFILSSLCLGNRIALFNISPRIFKKRKMKHLKLILLVTFVTKMSYSQDKWWKLDKRDIWASSTMFVAGWADGTAEISKWHYDDFESFYGDVNDEWYDPRISWKNKYKNQDVSQGPAFFGSTTFLVGTTDNYHMMRSIRNLSIAATLFIVPRCEFDWRRMLLRVFCYTLANRAGFWIGYELPLRINK